MKAKFEKAFLKGVRKYAGIKKQIEQKVHQIIEHPVELGEKDLIWGATYEGRP